MARDEKEEVVVRTYFSKTDTYHDENGREIPVRRINGYFDKKNRFHIISEEIAR